MEIDRELWDEYEMPEDMRERRLLDLIEEDRERRKRELHTPARFAQGNKEANWKYR
jgi:hypothetical protein